MIKPKRKFYKLRKNLMIIYSNLSVRKKYALFQTRTISYNSGFLNLSEKDELEFLIGIYSFYWVAKFKKKVYSQLFKGVKFYIRAIEGM